MILLHCKCCFLLFMSAEYVLHLMSVKDVVPLNGDGGDVENP